MNVSPLDVRTTPRRSPIPAPAPTPGEAPPQPVDCAAPAATPAPRRSALAQALSALPLPFAQRLPKAAQFLHHLPLTMLRHQLITGESLGCRPANRQQPPETLALDAALSLQLPASWPPDQGIPELPLLRDPRALVQRPDAWKALLKAHGHPTWLASLLNQETPQTDPNAIFAQENRLRALARYLLLLRASATSFETAERLSTVLPAVLALASVESRHRLLCLLVGHSGSPAQLDRVLAAWREAGPGDARLLALGLHLACPQQASQPSVRAVFECRAVVKDGVVARRALGYILRPELSRRSDVGQQVISWATDVNLLRLLRLGAGESTTHKLAGTVMDAEGACADRGGKAAWLEACAADQQRNQVALALLADRRARGKVGYQDLALLTVELERLEQAFAWLATQPGSATPGAFGQDLCARMNEEGGDEPPLPEVFDEALKALRRVRATVRAPKKSLRSDWTQALLTQLEGCVEARAAEGRALRTPAQPGVPKPEVSRGESPQEAFFALKPVRSYVNHAVAPLVLALQQHTPLLHALARQNQGVDINGVSKPEQVVSLCIPWFKAPADAALLERFLNEVKAPANLVAFYARSHTWSQDYRTRALPVLERLLRASLDGTLPALRRDSPQMRALRSNPAHRAGLARWEAGGSQALPADDGTGEAGRVYDTADLGDTFDVMAQIAGCQSPTAGYASHNVGNLGRLMDGSKRVIVVRDARGKVRSRAIVRLMQDPNGAPVVALSTLFVANHDRSARRALAEYAAKRAAELGFESVYTSFVSQCPLTDGPYTRPLTSLGAELPDYYDELGGLVDGDATFNFQRPMERLTAQPDARTA